MRLVVALALVALPRIAFAQDASEARRRAMIEQAATASRAGNHRGAIELLTRAGALRMTAGLRMVLAQEQRLDDRLTDAFDSATRCLEELPPTGDDQRASVQAECTALVDALRPRVGRLRVLTPTPAPRGLRVELGGVALDPGRYNDLVTVSPGALRVTASADDGTRFDATITVSAGGDGAVTVALARPIATSTNVAEVAPLTAQSTREVGGFGVGRAGLCVRVVGGRVVCRGYVGERDALAFVEGVSGAVSLAVGGSHACAVVANGAVRCWGDNSVAQLGAGDTAAHAEAVEAVGVRDAVSAVAGGEHTCAARSDGRVMCWGNNNGGQLGDGTTTARSNAATVVDLGPVAELSAGPTFTCARLRDGTAACWGNNSARQSSPRDVAFLTRPETVPDVSRLVALRASADAVCGLRDDGTVWCWGGGDLGGYGYTHRRSARGPARVPGLSDVIDLAAGYGHVCALTRVGAVWCWGDADGAVLGALRVANPYTPRRVTPLPPARALAAGHHTTCALGRDGALRCWGELGFTSAGEAPRISARPEVVRLPDAAR